MQKACQSVSQPHPLSAAHPLRRARVPQPPPHAHSSALRGYLQRECAPSQISDDIWQRIQQLLLTCEGMVVCDSYGNHQLLDATQLPVVCHRKDARLFQQQMQQCLEAAAAGAVLVSARIANGEQQIMDEVVRRGFPVVLVTDNGFPERYHPSARQTELCSSGALLLLSPWHYHYRPVSTHITVAECKTMNCIVQAICRRKDNWWTFPEMDYS